MLKESCNNIIKDNYENINERDKDVNRLYFLLYRAVLYNLDNPSHAMKKFKIGPIDLFNYKSLAFYIEGIADESRRMARYSRHLKINQKERKELSRFFEKINSFYLETLKSVYSHDVESAFQLSAQKKLLNKEIDSYPISNADINYMNMVSRIRRLISFIHNLGRIIYTSENGLKN